MRLLGYPGETLGNARGIIISSLLHYFSPLGRRHTFVFLLKTFARISWGDAGHCWGNHYFITSSLFFTLRMTTSLDYYRKCLGMGVAELILPYLIGDFTDFFNAIEAFERIGIRQQRYTIFTGKMDGQRVHDHGETREVEIVKVQFWCILDAGTMKWYVDSAETMRRRFQEGNVTFCTDLNIGGKMITSRPTVNFNKFHYEQEISNAIAQGKKYLMKELEKVEREKKRQKIFFTLDLHSNLM